MKAYALAVIFSGIALNSCGAQTDHPINQQLGKELAERSRSGLGLARFSNGTDKVLGIHFFDGRDEKLSLEIDGALKVTTQGTIAIVDEDPAIGGELASALRQGDSAQIREKFERLGGSIVLLSNAGKIERRSAMGVTASVIAVTRDKQRFAFIGVPRGVSYTEVGVYIGDFTSTHPSRIVAFGSDDPQRQINLPGKATLDWSPQGTTLLFSYRGTITAFDIDTAISKKIADGGTARWSPAGSQISFVGRAGDANLLDLSTGKISAIDPGFKIAGPMEWSPDGKYLLIPEGVGSHVPYGCHWVYRISDAAFFPVCDYHLINPPPFWIQYDR